MGVETFTGRGEAMNEESKKRVTNRVNRIAGQVAGVQKMLAEDRYCVEVLTQIAAVRSSLDALGVELITRHLETCVVGHGTGTEHPCAKPMSKEQLLAEVRTTLALFLK